MEPKKKCSFNFLKLFSLYAEMPMSADGREKKKKLKNLQITALPVSNNFFWLEYYHFRNY